MKLTTLNAIEAYRASLTARSMAEAIFEVHLAGPMDVSPRSTSLLSAVRHSAKIRKESLAAARRQSEKVADMDTCWPDYDFELGMIRYYKEYARTGYIQTSDASTMASKVRAALVIRDLKNESRKYKRLALSLAPTEEERAWMVLATLSTPTSPFYHNWAKRMIDEQ